MKRVLVTDDNSALADNLAEILEDEGYEVHGDLRPGGSDPRGGRRAAVRLRSPRRPTSRHGRGVAPRRPPRPPAADDDLRPDDRVLDRRAHRCGSSGGRPRRAPEAAPHPPPALGARSCPRGNEAPTRRRRRRSRRRVAQASARRRRFRRRVGSDCTRGARAPPARHASTRRSSTSACRTRTACTSRPSSSSERGSRSSSSPATTPSDRRLSLRAHRSSTPSSSRSRSPRTS